MKTIKMFIILIILITGCSEPQTILADRTTRQSYIEINVCSPPYSAIPNDTISDSDAFQLAVDVANSLKGRSIFDTINVVIVIPLGEYILDRTLDFTNANLEILNNYAVFGIEGTNIQISNVHITDY